MAKITHFSTPFVVFVGLLLGGLLAFLLYPNTHTSSLSRVSEKVTVANIGEYTIFNLIAAEQGFFRENGLDAEIKEYSSGPAAMDALLSGEVDINVAADFVGVRNIFANPQIRILAQVNHHRVFQLAGRKDAGIMQPSDLKGKRIGVTKNSAGEFFLGDFLTFNNLDLTDVSRVDLTPASMSAQLETKEIDAVVVFEPHIFNLKKHLTDNLSVWDVQGDQNTSALIYTTQTFLENHSEIIEKYLGALVKAEKYYTENTEETKKFIGQKLGYDSEYIDYSWPKFDHFIGLEQDLLLSMERKAQWVIDNKLTDKNHVPNYLEYIYFDSLQSVKPESITIIR